MLTRDNLLLLLDANSSEIFELGKVYKNRSEVEKLILKLISEIDGIDMSNYRVDCPDSENDLEFISDKYLCIHIYEKLELSQNCFNILLGDNVLNITCTTLERIK